MSDEPEYSSEDDLARMRAEFDQAKNSIADMARLYWTFYSALLETGFDEQQAFGLTIAQLQALNS